ncbi:MAG TPA: hypothetical protein VKF32_02605 [Thermoanaerobaculia bacterium]|nr:hypothetical protein [Thermoanaerobaculia bacterium]
MAHASPAQRRLTVRCESGSWVTLDDATGRAISKWRGEGVLELAGRDEDDDWLTVDLRASGACAPLPDIRFDGGVGGYDGMSIVGDGIASASYEPSAGETGTGRFRIGSSTVSFSNLEPLDVSGMTTFTAPLGSPVVATLANGVDFATGTNGALVLSGTSVGVPFESIAFRNITSLAITTGYFGGPSPDDVITLASSNVTAGITNIAVVTTSPGNDYVHVNGPFFFFTGTVQLGSATIDEGASGSIGAVGLRVDALGSVTLDQHNGVVQLAGTASSNFVFKSDIAFHIGSVLGETGISAGGNLTLGSADTIDVGAPMSAGGPIVVQAPVNVKARRAGDENGDGFADVSDVFYLINYLFAGGPAPY